MVWTGTVHRPTNTTFAHLRTSGCRGWCNAPKFARQGAGSPAFRTMGRMQGVVHCTQFADCAGDALSHIRVRTTFKLALNFATGRHHAVALQPLYILCRTITIPAITMLVAWNWPQ